MNLDEVTDYKLSTLANDTVSLVEGAEDPHVLKAVFLAGAGGSGKSKVADEMFIGSGLKVIDQDKHLTRMLAAAEIPLSQVGMHYSLQKKAQELKNAEVRQYGLRRLGMIVDSTGWDAPRILEPMKKLKALGYDCYMVFVSTSLETALKRNKDRADQGGRDVPDAFIKTAHHGAHSNLPKFKEAFGKNLFVIDNDAEFRPTTWSTIVAPALRKLGRKILTTPLRNPVGKEWLQQAMHEPSAEKKDLAKEQKKWPRPERKGIADVKPAQMPGEAPKLAQPAAFKEPEGVQTVNVDGRQVKVIPWQRPAWMKAKYKKPDEAEEAPPTDEIGKEFLGRYDGLNWYLVDGVEVRKWLTDFIGGGHPLAYPDLIPDGEGWIERMKDWSDTVAIATHELTEYTRMKYAKERYTVAHKASNDAEAVTRAILKKAQSSNESR